MTCNYRSSKIHRNPSIPNFRVKISFTLKEQNLTYLLLYPIEINLVEFTYPQKTNFFPNSMIRDFHFAILRL